MKTEFSVTWIAAPALALLLLTGCGTLRGGKVNRTTDPSVSGHGNGNITLRGEPFKPDWIMLQRSIRRTEYPTNPFAGWELEIVWKDGTTSKFENLSNGFGIGKHGYQQANAVVDLPRHVRDVTEVRVTAGEQSYDVGDFEIHHISLFGEFIRYGRQPKS